MAECARSCWHAPPLTFRALLSGHDALRLPADYAAQGTEITIDDLKIYTVGAGDKAIIVLPEVFGWGGHLKSICDQFAKEGFLVVRTIPH
jgi:hypothetical protein